METHRLSAPAVARNRDPILDILRETLPPQGLVLEIASGSGEHAIHFARNLPALTFQPSDPNDDARASIAAWSAASGAANISPPLALDAASPITLSQPWPIDRADAILCINMIHISPWEATLGLFAGARKLLAEGAPLYLYGPYKRWGEHTAPSNVAFDAWLHAQDSGFGVRDLETVAEVAAQNGFGPPQIIEMPANNLSVIFRRI